jgi:hypothetical protein
MVYESRINIKVSIEALAENANNMVYLFACMTPTDFTTHSHRPFVRKFLDWKEGVLLGGNAGQFNRILDLELSYADQNRKLPPGYGYSLLGGITKHIVTPTLE